MALAVKGQRALQAHCETSSEKSMNGNVYSQVIGSTYTLIDQRGKHCSCVTKEDTEILQTPVSLQLPLLLQL